MHLQGRLRTASGKHCDHACRWSYAELRNTGLHSEQYRMASACGGEGLGRQGWHRPDVALGCVSTGNLQDYNAHGLQLLLTADAARLVRMRRVVVALGYVRSFHMLR